MSESRLGGKARTPINQCDDVRQLHINVIPTMSKALELSRRQFWSKRIERDDSAIAHIGTRPVDGDKARLDKAMEISEQLVAGAIDFDSRLARRAQWRRRDEGEHLCTALLAEGDDQPFYKHTRAVVNDATMAGEPVRIVISTDDKDVPEGTAAAFIATARLVQQFVPLEIWWQGAWLNQYRTRGFVSLVPLVQGDMDFSRLEFCIADPYRDRFSYQVMGAHAVLDLKESWNGCGYRAEEHYIMGEEVKHSDGRQRKRGHFISHKGISADPGSVANHAARWLGWVVKWETDYSDITNATSAAQSLPPEPSGQRSGYTLTDADRISWKAEQYRQEQQAASRLEHA